MFRLLGAALFFLPLLMLLHFLKPADALLLRALCAGAVGGFLCRFRILRRIALRLRRGLALIRPDLRALRLLRLVADGRKADGVAGHALRRGRLPVMRLQRRRFFRFRGLWHRFRFCRLVLTLAPAAEFAHDLLQRVLRLRGDGVIMNLFFHLILR